MKKIKGICSCWNQVSLFNQIWKVFVIGRWSHTNGISDGSRGEGDGVSVCIGSEVEIQFEGLCAQIPGGRLPVCVLDAKEV